MLSFGSEQVEQVDKKGTYEFDQKVFKYYLPHYRGKDREDDKKACNKALNFKNALEKKRSTVIKNFISVTTYY